MLATPSAAHWTRAPTAPSSTLACHVSQSTSTKRPRYRSQPSIHQHVSGSLVASSAFLWITGCFVSLFSGSLDLVRPSFGTLDVSISTLLDSWMLRVFRQSRDDHDCIAKDWF
ncbi:hypothetical protein CB0940_06259 [Cercospora beticola]|uniref:Uncharacterized protein n=1 Tax=Cercospora beticola TaxID=122368 RepID=A0A2G5I0X7_CERBT|nr:hypothetical protein CB0940_06259 [Cercospora beticola]PIA98444.1 hypothetical protein CB0940_06259 [Cercospora beticola]